MGPFKQIFKIKVFNLRKTQPYLHLHRHHPD